MDNFKLSGWQVWISQTFGLCKLVGLTNLCLSVQGCPLFSKKNPGLLAFYWCVTNDIYSVYNPRKKRWIHLIILNDQLRNIEILTNNIHPRIQGFFLSARQKDAQSLPNYDGKKRKFIIWKTKISITFYKKYFRMLSK